MIYIEQANFELSSDNNVTVLHERASRGNTTRPWANRTKRPVTIITPRMVPLALSAYCQIEGHILEMYMEPSDRRARGVVGIFLSLW